MKFGDFVSSRGDPGGAQGRRQRGCDTRDGRALLEAGKISAGRSRKNRQGDPQARRTRQHRHRPRRGGASHQASQRAALGGHRRRQPRRASTSTASTARKFNLFFLLISPRIGRGTICGHWRTSRANFATTRSASFSNKRKPPTTSGNCWRRPTTTALSRKLALTVRDPAARAQRLAANQSDGGGHRAERR